jgi:gliding-associated putative ABC transporter substrate-binding component GldG
MAIKLFRTQRQKQFALTSAAGVALVGVSVLLLNVLSNWGYLRWDITSQNAYSLSSASKKLVRTVDDPVIIKVYFSTNLPSPYNSYARYVRDVLTEYRAASRGKVRFEFVPPQPQREFEERALQAGMAPLQFEEVGSDQLQIRRGFMGLVLFYRDRSEAVPVVKGVQQLEYELTSRLAKMARKNKKVIGLVTGHGESKIEGSQMKVAQDLPTFYDLRPIELPAAADAPIEADALLIAGPKQRYDEKSLWAIDQAIMRGIPAAFLLNRRSFMVQQFMMMPAASTGLEEMVKNYGVSVSDELVYDAQCEVVQMTQNIGGFGFTTNIRYPFVPSVTRFEKKNPILQGIQSVGLPFAFRLNPESPAPAGVTFTPLLESSEKSWTAPASVYQVAPNAVPVPKPGQPSGPYILGGLLEGTFPSFFAGKEGPIKGATPIAKSPKNSIVVIGTSQMIDPNLPEFRGVDALMTNILAYLSKDETLIGIQSKGEIFRPLKPISGRLRDLIKFICILGIPALPILLGLVRWRRRQAWRKAIAAGFALSGA